METGRTRAYLSAALAVLLVSFALAFAAPSRGASLSQVSDDTKQDEPNLVTRGRLAQQVANAAGFDEDPGGQIFEDVPPGSHYYDWVNRLAKRQVIGGV